MFSVHTYCTYCICKYVITGILPSLILKNTFKKSIKQKSKTMLTRLCHCELDLKKLGCGSL